MVLQRNVRLHSSGRVQRQGRHGRVRLFIVKSFTTSVLRSIFPWAGKPLFVQKEGARATSGCLLQWQWQ